MEVLSMQSQTMPAAPSYRQVQNGFQHDGSISKRPGHTRQTLATPPAPAVPKHPYRTNSDSTLPLHNFQQQQQQAVMKSRAPSERPMNQTSTQKLTPRAATQPAPLAAKEISVIRHRVTPPPEAVGHASREVLSTTTSLVTTLKQSELSRTAPFTNGHKGGDIDAKSPVTGATSTSYSSLEAIDDDDASESEDSLAGPSPDELTVDGLIDLAEKYLVDGYPKYALYYCSHCLKRTTSNWKAWAIRSECYMQSGKCAEAIRDCNEVLRLNPAHVYSFLRRARCLQRCRRLPEAKEDAVYACKLDKSSKLAANLLEELELITNIQDAMENKDHYQTLRISRTSGEAEIKKSYKDACLRWHPDRWATAHEAEQEYAALCFKECNYAYQVLGEPSNRIKYDYYLVQREVIPNLPHPMDAPHHYQYNPENMPDPHQHAIHVHSVAQQRRASTAAAAASRANGLNRAPPAYNNHQSFSPTSNGFYSNSHSNSHSNSQSYQQQNYQQQSYGGRSGYSYY